MTDAVPASRRDWKHIAALAVWLLLAFPLGLWKLWQDDALSAATKWRLAIYAFLIPALLYLTYSFWSTNQALQKVMP